MKDWQEITKQLFKKKPEGVPRKQKMQIILQHYRKTKDPFIRELCALIGNPNTWNTEAIDKMYDHVMGTKNPVKANVHFAATDEKRQKLTDFHYSMQMATNALKGFQIKDAYSLGDWCPESNPKGKTNAQIAVMWTQFVSKREELNAILIEMQKELKHVAQNA